MNSQRWRSPAGAGGIFEVSVVNEDESEDDHPHLVDGTADSFDARRLHVAHCVADEDRHPSPMQPRQDRRMQPGPAGVLAPRSFRGAHRPAARADHQHVAGTDLYFGEPLPLLEIDTKIGVVGSSQSTPRKRGMSTSTPRVT